MSSQKRDIMQKVFYNKSSEEIRVIVMDNIDDVDFLNRYEDNLKNHKYIPEFENIFTVEDALSNDMIAITSDNIYEYYRYMNGDELEKYLDILNNIFVNRLDKINDDLNLDGNLVDMIDLDYFTDFKLVGINVCDKKDILESIDEYILKIKNSESYQDYKENCQ